MSGEIARIGHIGGLSKEQFEKIEENAQTYFDSERLVDLIKILDGNLAARLLANYFMNLEEIRADLKMIEIAARMRDFELIEKLLNWYRQKNDYEFVGKPAEQSLAMHLVAKKDLKIEIYRKERK